MEGQTASLLPLIPGKCQGLFSLRVHPIWGCLQLLLCPGLGSDLILRAASFESSFPCLSAVLFLIKGQEAEGLVTMVTIY